MLQGDVQTPGALHQPLQDSIPVTGPSLSLTMCYRLNVCAPTPSPYVENLVSKVMGMRSRGLSVGGDERDS